MLKAELEALVKEQEVEIASLRDELSAAQDRISELEAGVQDVELTETVTMTDEIPARKLPAVDRR